MAAREQRQLINYLAPAAPATRHPAEGPVPRLRPEIGFTPKWYRSKLGIDFGRRWHTDPAYRRRTVLQMRELLRQCFPRTRIGGIDRSQRPLDLLAGTLGTCTVAAGVSHDFQDYYYSNCKQMAEGGDSSRRFLGDIAVCSTNPNRRLESPPTVPFSGTLPPESGQHLQFELPPYGCSPEKPSN